MRELLKASIGLVFLFSSAAVNADHLKTYAVADGTFLLDWQDDFNPNEKQLLQDWLQHMGRAISLLNGEWPRKTIRIAFKRIRYDGPVPFGRVLRDRPEGIQFYVNPAQPLEAFVSQWTGYHEFSHLFIPYPGRADIWFSEGLASYYQNILQVRAGVLTPDEAFKRFQAAFARGTEDSAHADLTLGELSREMLKRRAFMRVYWSGALYFMEADVRLREAAQNITLDDVLRDYGRCCLHDGQEQRGRKIAAEFDRIAESSFFTELYDQYAQASSMPEWQDLLQRARNAGILDSRTKDLR